MSDIPTLGIIGGSGLYQIPGLQDIEERVISTPFGEPSSRVVVGTLEGRRVAFLARHGIGHFITPTEVNYRANIYALKSIGVERVVSVSACGSLREDYAPGDIIVPDQLFDNTKDRKRSFFGEGFVGHIGVADPYCNAFSGQIFKALKKAGAKARQGGAFITIEGPRFSTRAESNVFRSWGMSIIGMTASPEAFLAKEAELCYGVMAHVTDYDVWHMTEEPVSVEAIIRVMNQNTKTAQEALRHLAADLDPKRDCECPTAVSAALITAPDKIPAETRQNLALLVGKYLKS